MVPRSVTVYVCATAATLHRVKIASAEITADGDFMANSPLFSKGTSSALGIVRVVPERAEEFSSHSVRRSRCRILRTFDWITGLCRIVYDCLRYYWSRMDVYL